MNTIAEIVAIDKFYPETGIHANNAISFTVQEDEIVGIVGDNGAGKSTLVTILAGEQPADSGSIILDSLTLPNGQTHPGVGLVHQHPRILPDRPVWESLCVGLSDMAIFSRRKARKSILARLDSIGISLPVDLSGNELSIGQLHIAELAAVLMRKPRLLILDEPTASCTPAERESILKIIQNQRGIGIIYISHRKHEIQLLAKRIFRIDKGIMSEIDSDELYTVQRIHENRMKPMFPESRAVARLENINAKSRVLGELENISIDVFPGEIVGVSGYRDHGLLMLEDVIAGYQAIDSGRRSIRNRNYGSIHEARSLGMRYIPTKRFVRGLAYELSIIDSLREHIKIRHPESTFLGLWRQYCLKRQSSELLSKLGLPENEQLPLRSYSGGMRQRLLIGRETDVHDAVMAFALVCEPNLGLDADGVELLWDSLRELAARGAGILLLSSAREEIEPICHRLLILHDGRIAEVLKGNTK
ncbi:ATP-binding cassette domain-containing protein [Spirochaeta dissipatitropha]